MRHVLMVGLTLLVCSSAFAQRTFVASTGLDTNPCSRTSPCRSFNVAIGLVAAGGEVVVLDSAGYGTASITKSVSLVVPSGVYAGVTVSTGAGIAVNAPAGVVNLRGLTFNGTGGTDGITFAGGTGSQLHIDDVVVSGFSAHGFYASDNGRFTIRDSMFRDNAVGVLLDNVTTLVEGSIDHTRFDQNTSGGLEQRDHSRMTVRDTVFFSNGNNGRTNTSGGPAELTVDNCIFSGPGEGLLLQSINQGSGIIRFGRSTFVNLNDGLSKAAVSGSMVSFGNNQFAGNIADGTVNIDTTIPLQ